MDKRKFNRREVNTCSDLPLSEKEHKQWELVNFCEFDKYAATSYCAVHGVDEALNLGDITKVDETKLNEFNMICGGSPCFVKGTNILTERGYKEIENLKVGDVVYTKEGNWKRVLRVGSDGEKEVFELKAMGVLPLIGTSNHPFWIREGKRIWNNDKRRYDYYLDDPQKKQLIDLRTGEGVGDRDYIGVPIIKDINNELWHLSNEVLWILGRYVADGHLTKSEIVLSIGKDKIQSFDEIREKHRTYQHTDSCYRVVFNKSSDLYKIISFYNFGTHAINKNIPVEILQLPKQKLKSFLEGYLNGDGCEIKSGLIKQATTISKNLAETLVLAVQKTYGVGCKIYYTERPKQYTIQGRIVNQHDTYMIRFLHDSCKQSYYIEEDFVWYPIKKIIKQPDKRQIFNIEVEDDHTYLANNVAVFNCQDFSVAGKQAGSRWKCNDCGEEYNPLTIHYSKRHKCPNCNSENIDKTRSSLLVEWLRIIRANKPKWGIYENVKNIVGKQFRDTFQMFLDELHEYGYNTYFKVLNAKDFGIPQNRERVYLIIILKEYDNGLFKFPEGFESGICLKDILEDDVDEKYYVNTPKAQELLNDLVESGKLDKPVSNAIRGGAEEV